MVNTKPGLKDPILHISLSICCQEPGIKVLNSVSQSLYFPLSLWIELQLMEENPISEISTSFICNSLRVL